MHKMQSGGWPHPHLTAGREKSDFFSMAACEVKSGSGLGMRLQSAAWLALSMYFLCIKYIHDGTPLMVPQLFHIHNFWFVGMKTPLPI